jgi:hypothetical protein
MDTAKGLADAASKKSTDATAAMGKSRAAAIAAHNAFVTHAVGARKSGNF